MHYWNGVEEFPPVITVFSAPNYCGDYGNTAAVFVSEGENYTFKSFTESSHKPFVLPSYPLMDAFAFFNDDLNGHVLDFLYHMCKTAASALDENMSKVLSASNSCDDAYLAKIMSSSLK